MTRMARTARAMTTLIAVLYTDPWPMVKRVVVGGVWEPPTLSDGPGRMGSQLVIVSQSLSRLVGQSLSQSAN